MESPPTLFDRALWRQRRGRASFEGELHRLVAESLAERLADFSRQFPRAVVVGTGGGQFAEILEGRFGVETVVQVDASERVARDASNRLPNTMVVAADEEVLPLADGKFDLAILGLTLHWTNDPLATLVQLRRSLVPDGMLLGATLGGETLAELRECLLLGESDSAGGASPRVSPMAGLRDCGNLLVRAGYALPVADIERHCLEMASPLHLMREIRSWGEANALSQRGLSLSRRTLARACEMYGERYPLGDGVQVTFEVVHMCGWSPHPDQPRPLKPGSATRRLADALGTTETRLPR